MIDPKWETLEAQQKEIAKQKAMLEKFQNKVSEQKDLIQRLRKNYLKEINNLRDAHN